MFHQSKIIVSQNADKSYLISLLNLDISNIELNTIKSDESSIGIKELENISEKTSKKSELIKVVLIISSEKLTLDAQNSILKILEEPSDNTLIILQTNNQEKLLETIKSRCEMLYDVKEGFDEEYSNIEFIFKDFTNLKYLEKIRIVESFLKEYTNKSSIRKAVLAILNELAKKQVFLHKVNKIEKAYKALEYNVSPKLIFDYIALMLED